MWLDDTEIGCWKTTKKLYGKNYPWPISELLLYWRRRELASELLRSSHSTLLSLRNEAVESVRLLSEILAGQDYFGGSRPGYVDAIAFGLFAVALTLLPITNELRSMLETCSNLRSHVSRIRREFHDSNLK